MFDLHKLIRPNIKKLKPYSSARSEFNGAASVFLDANENSYGSPLNESFNRYPDPLQWKLKTELAKIKKVEGENIFIGNGSDEVIDLAYRIFCEPQLDNIIICPPTYGMYEVSANINDVEIKKINLTDDFQLDVDKILAAVDENTKLLFICSPNNPTGNIMHRNDIENLINSFPGIVIIDEAYADFSKEKSFSSNLERYPNVIVMQTLSKAWGLASLRLGLAFASKEIINLFNKVKPPYNVNKASQHLGLIALQNAKQVSEWVQFITEQREFLIKEFKKYPFIKKIYQSDANFLLIKVADAGKLYNYLADNKIVVRNRSNEVMCENCLRITVGTGEENKILLEALNRFIA